MDISNITIDGQKLEVDSIFKSAMHAILNENKNVFVTGSAGTGKTFFLKTLCKISKRNIAVVAPTGIAALNANGRTIHSFFNFPKRPLLPQDNFYTFNINEDKIELFKKIDTLIIDEISMVRCDVFVNIDRILRFYRKNSEPFGGVQVVIIGDPFQIPPVVNQNEYSILRDHYNGRFFFSTDSFRSANFQTYELKQVRRQKDKSFIDLLNRVRLDQVSDSDLRQLSARSQPVHDDKGFIHITTTNDQAKAKNDSKLASIDKESYTFLAIKSGTVNMRDMIAEDRLILKLGAQVMFLANDFEGKYVNGTIGKVIEIKENKIIVQIENTGAIIDVKQYSWDNEEYFFDPDSRSIKVKFIGSLKQYPIKLAWSITVHKSQGLTFDKVVADLNRAFVPGQIYVGLSRCTNLQGLHLESAINQYRLRQHPRVIDFYNSLNIDLPF